MKSCLTFIQNCVKWCRQGESCSLWSLFGVWQGNTNQLRLEHMVLVHMQCVLNGLRSVVSRLVMYWEGSRPVSILATCKVKKRKQKCHAISKLTASHMMSRSTLRVQYWGNSWDGSLLSSKMEGVLGKYSKMLTQLPPPTWDRDLLSSKMEGQ